MDDEIDVMADFSSTTCLTCGQAMAPPHLVLAWQHFELPSIDVVHCWAHVGVPRGVDECRQRAAKKDQTDAR